MKTTVTARGQTVIPARVRRAHRITPRTRIEWIDDGQTIRVVPLPEDPIAAARGAAKSLRAVLLRDRKRARQCGCGAHAGGDARPQRSRIGKPEGSVRAAEPACKREAVKQDSDSSRGNCGLGQDSRRFVRLRIRVERLL